MTAAPRRLLVQARAHLQCRCDVVDEGDAQVLMVDGVEIDTVAGMLDAPLATLHVLPEAAEDDVAGIAPERRLTRPLRGDAVIDALRAIERSVQRPAGEGDDTPALSRPTPLPLRPMPPIPTGPSRPQESSAYPRLMDAHSVFRLRRWPSPDLLQGDRDTYRMPPFCRPGPSASTCSCI